MRAPFLETPNSDLGGLQTAWDMAWQGLLYRTACGEGSGLGLCMGPNKYQCHFEVDVRYMVL